MVTQESTNFIQLIVIVTIILFLLVGFIISFLFLYKRRVNNHRRQLEKMKEEFEQELLKTQIELQEQVLDQVSSELHDNIGQLLTVIKIGLGTLGQTKGLDEKNRIQTQEIREQVVNAIEGMRSISKTLSHDFVQDSGLVEALKITIDRVNRTKHLKASLEIKGENYAVDPKAEIILFRTAQEIINNALKHSGAHTLNISLDYGKEAFAMHVSDDGKGFELQETEDREPSKSGRGIKNMRNRVKIIGGVLNLESSQGNGTRVEIILKHNTQQPFAATIQ